GKSLPELIAASQSGQVLNVKAEAPDPDYPNAQQTYSFSVRSDCSGAEYWPVPPDDFSVSPDTVRLAETPYCCVRARARVQDLIAEGFDAALVAGLESYAGIDQDMQRARDHAGEHQRDGSGQGAGEGAGSDLLRLVEIRKHYIRLKDKAG